MDRTITDFILCQIKTFEPVLINNAQILQISHRRRGQRSFSTIKWRSLFFESIRFGVIIIEKIRLVPNWTFLPFLNFRDFNLIYPIVLNFTIWPVFLARVFLRYLKVLILCSKITCLRLFNTQIVQIFNFDHGWMWSGRTWFFSSFIHLIYDFRFQFLILFLMLIQHKVCKFDNLLISIVLLLIWRGC